MTLDHRRRRLAALLAGPALALLLASCSDDDGRGVGGIDAASEMLVAEGIPCTLEEGGRAREIAGDQRDGLRDAGYCAIDGTTIQMVVFETAASASLATTDLQVAACEEAGDDVTIVRGYDWVAVLRPAARGLGDSVGQALDGAVAPTSCAERGDIPARRLPIGEPSELGSFEVALTEVDPDAEERVLALDPSNEPATRERWVLMSLDATNIGDEPLSPYEELTLAVVADAGEETYVPGPCGRQVSPKDRIEPGTTSRQVACFDLPRSALDGATLRVRVGGDEARWLLQ